MRHRKGQRELVQTEEKGLDEVEEEREGKLLRVTHTNHTHSLHLHDPLTTSQHVVIARLPTLTNRVIHQHTHALNLARCQHHRRVAHHHVYALCPTLALTQPRR